MESWRKVWRDGLAPLISTEGLEALRTALCNDDARLLQGATTTPPPLQCVQDWPVEAACVLGFCGWQGDGLETVGLRESLRELIASWEARVAERFRCSLTMTEEADQLSPELNIALYRLVQECLTCLLYTSPSPRDS